MTLAEKAYVEGVKQRAAKQRLENAAPAMLEALHNAEQRIAELCQMVCHLSGNPKKVRAEDYADKVRAAIAKAEGTN